MKEAEVEYYKGAMSHVSEVIGDSGLVTVCFGDVLFL